MQHRGRGTLHFSDGREFCKVDYVIDERSPAGGRPGRLTGQLQRVGPGRTEHAPFSDFTKDPDPQKYGALQLADGRWWLCNVQEDGRANTYSNGIQPAGPQPKP